MNENGGGKAENAFSPGPPNEPKTLPAPWAIKIVPKTKRKGKGAQEGEVEANLRNIVFAFPT
jgi:hypothetical protein